MAAKVRLFENNQAANEPLAQLMPQMEKAAGITEQLKATDQIQKKYGWLRLWAIIGIINTPGPAPCSIEGLIYTQLPLELYIKGAPEIPVQTLLFSYLVANSEKLKFPWLRKYKIPLISVFLVSKWYLSTTSRLKNIVLPLCCYIVLAVIPTIYNYAVNSIFASLLTLGINVIPVVVIFLINYLTLPGAVRRTK